MLSVCLSACLSVHVSPSSVPYVPAEEFSAERVKNAFNDNLADIYGNLLLRIMSKKCMPDAVYPEICREHLPAFRGQ